MVMVMGYRLALHWEVVGMYVLGGWFLVELGEGFWGRNLDGAGRDEGGGLCLYRHGKRVVGEVCMMYYYHTLTRLTEVCVA